MIGKERLLANEAYRNDAAKADVDVLQQDFLLTPGRSLDSAEASLCPGDSGGPVYRDDRRGETVVGINSYYSFPPETADPEGISDTNWHTRVDSESRDRVDTWLASRVASTTRRGGGEPSSR